MRAACAQLGTIDLALSEVLTHDKRAIDASAQSSTFESVRTASVLLTGSAGSVVAPFVEQVLAYEVEQNLRLSLYCCCRLSTYWWFRSGALNML